MTALESQPIATSDPEGQRRLAAIVFTDVVGYSRLADQDEQKTLALVRRDLKIITDTCASLGGSALKNTGDGLLMCFSSAEAAVSCALRVQKAFMDAPKVLPPDEVLQHRIGIHLGDVFVSSSDVAGNDVNIANRLLGKAEPNGICISQTVYDVVKSKAGLQATYLGPVELKNIREHIPVYKLLLLAGEDGTRRAGAPFGLDELTSAAGGVEGQPRTGGASRRRRAAWLAVGAVAALALALAAVPILRRTAILATSPPAQPPAPSVWQDLLPLIAPPAQTLPAPWEMAEGALNVEATKKNNILMVPLTPRGDYQAEVTFTRLQGESDVVVYLPAPTTDPSKPPAQVTLHFGYGQKFDLLAQKPEGFVDSALAGRNGERFTALVTVEAKKNDIEVEVELNGKRHLRLVTPRDEMAPYAGAWATRGREQLLGLGVDDVHARFHSFRLKMLNGRAEKV